MRIIAFVTDGRTVRDILVHLGEPTAPPRIAPARGPPLWGLPDAGPGAFDPSPHRSTNSINASLGNAERRPPAKRAAGQAHAGGRRTRDASSLTFPKHPHLGLPWPRGDP